MNPSTKIILAAVLAVLVVGGGIYSLTKNKTNTNQAGSQNTVHNVNTNVSTTNTNNSNVNTAGSTVAACQTANLTGSLSSLQSGGTAGTYYYTLTVTNVGAQTCTITGSPTVVALDANGKEVGRSTPTAHTSAPVTVVANGKAYASIGFANSENFSTGTCKAVKSLVIYPPDQAAGITINNVDQISANYTGKFCQAYNLTDFSATAQ